MILIRRDGDSDIVIDEDATLIQVNSPKRNGRWTELKLWRTPRGNWVAQEVGRTEQEGERDRYKAQVCTDENCVIEFFGHGWLAKDLYDLAGINDTEKVD